MNGRYRIKLHKIFEALKSNCIQLNTWEDNFINDLFEKIEKQPVTWPQSKKLNEIYGRII